MLKIAPQLIPISHNVHPIGCLSCSFGITSSTLPIGKDETVSNEGIFSVILTIDTPAASIHIVYTN